MCYGRISVSFLYKGKDSKRKDSAESSSTSMLAPVETATEATAELTKLSPTEEPQSHQFARTHFRSATVCDYCNKKVHVIICKTKGLYYVDCFPVWFAFLLLQIWLKEAYMCCLCSMKCHKKCHERCMANTVCRGLPEVRFAESIANQNLQRSNNSSTPEIITTESEPTKILSNECDDEDESSSRKHLTCENTVTET